MPCRRYLHLQMAGAILQARFLSGHPHLAVFGQPSGANYSDVIAEPERPLKENTFDTRELRNVFGSFVTGVTVITTLGEDGAPYGLTANSFSSVSLEPPLVLWSQSLTSPSFPVFRDSDRFAVSVLAEHQIDISGRFARSAPDKFAGVETVRGLGGIPLICGATATLECRKVMSYPGGDHMVFIGQVERMERSKQRPLVFGSGRYLMAYPHDLGTFSPDLGLASLPRLQAVRRGTAVAAHLAAELKTTIGVSVWGTAGPTVVRWEESARPVSTNLRTGAILPILRSAAGQVFGAYLPRELTGRLIEAELRELAPPPPDAFYASDQEVAQALDFGDFLPHGLRDAMVPVDLKREGLDARRKRSMTPRAAELKLADVRERGVAVSSELVDGDAEADDIVAVSVPVFDSEGALQLVLTVLGTAAELADGAEADWSMRLLAAAGELSAQLGYRVPKSS